MALGNPLEAPLRSGKDTGEGGDGGGVAGVSSFKGRTGAVVPQNGDYNAGQITETALSKLMTAAERDKLAALDLTGYQVEPAEGAFVDGDKSKLDGIEDGATDDQTGAEIVSLIDSELGGTTWQSGSGAGATNLSIGTHDATQLEVAPESGTSATLPLATLPSDTNLSGLLSPAEKDKLAGVETGATADQTPAEIVAAVNSNLGQTDWQSGGSSGGTTTVLWASKVESVDVPGGGFAEVVLTNATGGTPTTHITGDLDIPTDDDDVSAWARFTADNTITIRVATIGPAITLSGTWKAAYAPKTSYSWFSQTVNQTVGGSSFYPVTVPAVGVANATHIVKFIYLPTTNAKLRASGVVGTDEVAVQIENTDAPGVLLDGDVEVVTQLKSAAFPVASTSGITMATDYDDLITKTADIVLMLCYHANDDGGWGWFKARESGDTVDYGHVMAHGSGGNWRYHRLGIKQGVADVDHFGAFASGDDAHRTTNTTAIRRAIAYLEGVATTSSGEGFTLLLSKGKGFYSVDDEFSFTDNLQGLKIHATENAHWHIRQYTTGKGVFIFTKTTVGSNHYRLNELHDGTISWRVQQSLLNFRSNAIMLTNAPSGSGGIVFGFDIRHCKFAFGRCVFTLLQAPLETGWTGTEPDAYTSAGSAFTQSVTFDDVKVEQMSGGLYHVLDEASGGPQLVFRNIKHTGGYPGTDILARELIVLRHNQIVTIEQLEHLWSTYGILWAGDAEWIRMTEIAAENTTLANGSELIRFNGAGTKFKLEGFRWKNSVLPANKAVVGVYNAKGTIQGGVEFAGVTNTAPVYLVRRYGGGTPNVGVQVYADTTGLTSYYTYPTGDAAYIGDMPTFGVTANTAG